MADHKNPPMKKLKTKTTFDKNWTNISNMVIQCLVLREIEMSVHHYTWVSSGDDPTYEMLDRVLVSTEW